MCSLWLQLCNVYCIVKCLRIEFAVSPMNLTCIGQNSACIDTCWSCSWGNLAQYSASVSLSHHDMSSTLAVLVCFTVGWDAYIQICLNSKILPLAERFLSLMWELAKAQDLWGYSHKKDKLIAKTHVFNSECMKPFLLEHRKNSATRTKFLSAFLTQRAL